METILVALLVFTVVVGLLLFWCFVSCAKRLDAVVRTHTPIRNLLGPPDPRYNNYDNDMLMQVCRDFLALRTMIAGSTLKYYPAEGVAESMIDIARLLKPYEDNLAELGWVRVKQFTKNALLDRDENGRHFVRCYGSFDWETVAILSEVAGVLSIFPEESDLRTELRLV
jgi:hypothetical protein